MFGSVAKRGDTAKSDIDLMVVSDRLTYADVFAALEPLHAELGRPVNPTVYSPADLRERMVQGNAFVKRVMAQPKIWILGTEHDIAA